MKTKQKTPFAAVLSLKCFFGGDLRLAEAKAGLMRNMVVDAFLYPLQRETGISLAPNSVNGVFPLPPCTRLAPFPNPSMADQCKKQDRTGVFLASLPTHVHVVVLCFFCLGLTLQLEIT